MEVELMSVSSDSVHPSSKSNPSILRGINSPVRQDRAEDGVDLEELPIGAILEIETGHTTYRLENLGNGSAIVSGHPKYCPEPITVEVHGSIATAGGVAEASGQLRWHFLGIGRRMVFLPPDHGVIRTSAIRAIRPVLGSTRPGERN
jgi:hypothetical protein